MGVRKITPDLEVAVRMTSIQKIGNLKVRDEETYSPMKLAKKTSTLIGRSGLPVDDLGKDAKEMNEKFKPGDLGSGWRKSLEARQSGPRLKK